MAPASCNLPSGNRNFGPVAPIVGSASSGASRAASQPGVTNASLFNRHTYGAAAASTPMLFASP